MPQHHIGSRSEIDELRDTVSTAARRALAGLVATIGSRKPLDALAMLKFEEIGFHPLEDRRLNIVEQVNQSFTYLASLAAAERVLEWHPSSAPIRLNLGTSAGYDLESESQSVAAEVFAAVRRTNNRKLARDTARVAEAPAEHKYVFFYCPNHSEAPFRIELFPDVQIVPLTQNQLWGMLREGA